MQRRTLSALLAGFAAAMFASTGAATGTVMYDSVPDPLPSHLDYSMHLRAPGSELGQVITPVVTGPLGSVTVTMTSRACQDGLWTSTCVTTPNLDGSMPTFEHPITINLYHVGDETPGAVPGALIGSVTRRIAVPYRPSTDCRNGGWSAECRSDYAFNATFDFTRERITLPEEFIVGVAFNTSFNDSSLEPAGPHDWLYIGMYTDSDRVGSVNYFDGGSGLRRHTVLDFDLMVRFETAPSGPVTADDCKAGGFAQYGFTNQGQCVSSVNASEHAGK